MRDEHSKKSKLSWSKTVRKWFSIKGKAQNFHADDVVGRGDEAWRTSFSERQASTVKKSRTERLSGRSMDRVWRGRNDLDLAQVTDIQEYMMFVATWNVGGRSPSNSLKLEDWLHAYPPADIYVLGFQEIVPLNAGNVLGAEDSGPARKWVSLIRKTLNNLPGIGGSTSYHTPSPVPNPIAELDADFEGATMRQRNSLCFHRRSFQSLSRSLRIDGDIMVPQPRLDRRFSVCERVSFGSRPSDFDPNFRWYGSSDDENFGMESPSTVIFSPMSYGYGASSIEERERQSGKSRYCLVASKQMVGLFLTIWVRSEIRDDVKNLKVSCVGRGLMGYLGNKGRRRGMSYEGTLMSWRF